MTSLRSWGILACLLAAGTVGAQTLSLDQAIQQALAQGPDAAVADATLAAARAADAQSQARAGLTLTSGLSYQAAKGVNDPVANFKLATAPSSTRVSSLTAPPDNVTPQQATGTLTLALPTTSLALSGGDTFQTNPDGSSLKSLTAGATLSQTLVTGYWGGSLQATADKSTLSYQSALLTARANRNKAVLNVKTAFFNLLATQDRLTVYNQTLGQRRDALKYIQVKAASGTATAYDIKVAQAAVRSAELDAASGQNAQTTAQVRLGNLLGVPVASTLQAAATSLAPPAATADEAVVIGMKNRVELQTTQLAVQSSAVDVSLGASGLWPTVTLTGGVNWSQGDSATTTGSTIPSTLVGTIGVRVTPPTIDAGSSWNQMLQAQAQQSVLATQLNLLRQSVPIDIQDAFFTWQINGQRLDLAQALLENADVNRQIVKSQFDAGAKLIADWLNAEVAYSTAQLSLVNARQTWQLSAATLQNLMGL